MSLLPLLAGCPVTAELPTKADVETLSVRETGAKYYLYVPSRYGESVEWPLILLCHGTSPYDTAWLEMREWAQFADDHGIIVAAPELEGVRGDFPPPPDKQLPKQRRDERTILGVVAAVRASHRVAVDRIFMTGWSAGGYAVLYTGLRNPEIFRALAIRQGNFDARFVAEIVPRLDRSQRVLICYGFSDPLRKQSEDAATWLREQGMYVDTEETTGSHRRLPVSIAWKYFEDIFRNHPWILVNAVAADPRTPRAVTYTLRAVPKPRAVRWDFGDGSGSREARARHEYREDGTYSVTVKVQLANGKWYKRELSVQVPRLAAGGSSSAQEPP